MVKQTINLEKVKLLAKTDDTSKAIMDVLSKRQRFSRESDLHKVVSLLGENIDGSQFNAFWEKLEEAGAGRYVKGRKGNSDRFKWYYPLTEVIQAAATGVTDEPLEPIPAKKRGPKKGSSRKSVSHKEHVAPIKREEKTVLFVGQPTPSVQNFFRIKAGRGTTIDLPANISAKEAETISRTIKKLYMHN